MKKKYDWNEEIKVSITPKKIVLQSLLIAIMLIVIIALRSARVLLIYKHYYIYIAGMFTILLFSIFLIVLAAYLFVVVKNLKK